MSNRVRILVAVLLAPVLLASACGPAPAAEPSVAPAATQQEPSGEVVESAAEQEQPTQEIVKSVAEETEPASPPSMELGPGAELDLIFVQHALCAWDSFWCEVETGIEQAASDTRVSVAIWGPDQFDLEQTAQLIDQAVAAQPDGIAVTVSDADLFREPIQRALDAGILVVAYNAGSGPDEDGVDYLTYLGQDEYSAGYTGGLRLADAGGTRGVCLNHQVGHVGLDARCEGFLSAMNVSGLPGEVLDIGSDASEAQARISEYHAANPDTDMFMTLGPSGAGPFYAFLDSAGLGPGAVFHGTFDLGEEIDARIKDGTTMYAIDQQPFLQGYAAVQTLVLANRYGIVPPLPVTATGPGFVDASNVDFQADPERPVALRFVQHALCTWDSFWCVVENGIGQAAAEMNVGVEVTGPETFDLARVTELIDEAVASQPDGLGVTVSDADQLREPVQRAVDASIPVVAYNAGRGPLVDQMAYMTYLGLDEYQGGYQAGLRLAGSGGARGICFNHQMGHPGLDARCEGFVQALREASIPADILKISSDATDAQGTIAAYLAGYPDADIVLTLGPTGAAPFYAYADAAGLGAGELKHGTFDLGEEIISHIKDGTTLFAVDQQPFLQGYGAVQVLVLKARYGITPAMPITPSGPAFVDASNVAIVEELAGTYR
jgi:simple sugar transport system substrate-binding protein